MLDPNFFSLYVDDKSIANNIAAVPAFKTIIAEQSLSVIEPQHCRLELVEGQAFFRLPGKNTVVTVDFLTRLREHRFRQAVGKKELLYKALKGRGSLDGQKIVDATTGLANDALLMMVFGLQVHMIECNPLLFLALDFSLKRLQHQTVSEDLLFLQYPTKIVESLRAAKVEQGDAVNIMRNWAGERPDIVYLDPMYHHFSRETGQLGLGESRSKAAKGLKQTAAVGKEAQLLRQLTRITPAVNMAERNNTLLEVALDCAARKVVVKRAPKADFLAERKPASQVEGKSVRYDIYPC